uniref:Uncharacterized protein n=1 Tax=Plectus sambesii TaxID=2011161 RepID=A0A914X237_9BILA
MSCRLSTPPATDSPGCREGGAAVKLDRSKLTLQLAVKTDEGLSPVLDSPDILAFAQPARAPFIKKSQSMFVGKLKKQAPTPSSSLSSAKTTPNKKRFSWSFSGKRKERSMPCGFAQHLAEAPLLMSPLPCLRHVWDMHDEEPARPLPHSASSSSANHVKSSK